MSLSKTLNLLFWLLLLLIGVVIYLNYAQIIFYVQEWQRLIHENLRELLIAVSNHHIQSGLLLIFFSFIYGVIHSVGPGHGKIIISTYLAIQPSQYKRALMITCLSSLLQGLVAILLISILAPVLSLSRKSLNLGELGLEKTGYLLIILIGVFFCYNALKIIYQQYKIGRRINKYKHQNEYQHNHQHDHQHSHHHHSCSCGHKHLPEATELVASKNNIWTNLTMIFAIGIRPCSGALLVMTFATMLGITMWGVLAVLAMAMGVALTISIIAYLVIVSRSLITRLYSQNRLPAYFNQISNLLLFLGGLMLIIMGSFFFIGTSAVINPILG